MPPARVVALLVLTCVLLAGCGGTTRPKQARHPSPNAADTDCRSRWSDLGDQLSGRDQAPYPSDLATRWNSVLATIDYYAKSAKAEDCDAALTEQQQAVTRIEQFTTELRVYDVRYRLAHVRDAATAYLTHPKKKPPKKLVRLALTQARKASPVAITDMKDGWTEAESADLSSETARTKALRDMRFLAGDSLPYQRADAALRILAKTR